MSSYKKRKVTLVPLVVILILIILSAGGWYFYKYYYLENNKYLGKWNREAEVTSYVSEAMSEWFNGAPYSDNIDYGDTQAFVKVRLSVGTDGSFTETIDEASYKKAQEQAKVVAVKGLKVFLERRLSAAGVSEEVTGKNIDDLITESIGMTAEEYLDAYGPQVLPDLDELESELLRTGKYTIDGDIITIVTPGKTTVIDYVAADGYFILNKETENPDAIGTPITNGDGSDTGSIFSYPVIYTKK